MGLFFRISTLLNTLTYGGFQGILLVLQLSKEGTDSNAA